MNQEIEYVARALYEAEDDAQAWDLEPEILKEEFRRYARAAIELMDQQKPAAAGVDLPKVRYAA